MTPLSALWLPILVSAVFVFVASSIIHMGPFWHRGDYPRLPKEDEVMNALRPFSIPPGGYMFPRPGAGADMRSPEFKAKLQQGPVAMVTVFPNGGTSMTRNLSLWFVFCLVVGLFAAYIAGEALPAGAPYLRVFQFAGATAFIGYSLALWEMSIWYQRDWSLTIKSAIDGLIFACLTAGTFGWLWPGA